MPVLAIALLAMGSATANARSSNNQRPAPNSGQVLEIPPASGAIAAPDAANGGDVPGIGGAAPSGQLSVDEQQPQNATEGRYAGVKDYMDQEQAYRSALSAMPMIAVPPAPMLILPYTYSRGGFARAPFSPVGVPAYGALTVPNYGALGPSPLIRFGASPGMGPGFTGPYGYPPQPFPWIGGASPLPFLGPSMAPGGMMRLHR